MDELYYVNPTIVAFRSDGITLYGIANGDSIICFENGMIFSFNDVDEGCLAELSWIDLTAEAKGDFVPEWKDIEEDNDEEDEDGED